MLDYGDAAAWLGRAEAALSGRPQEVADANRSQKAEEVERLGRNGWKQDEEMHSNEGPEGITLPHGSIRTDWFQYGNTWVPS
jgi:hypothetical protein